MTLLIMVSVILLPMLMIILSTLSVISMHRNLSLITDSFFFNIFWNWKMLFCYLSIILIFHYYPVTMESVLIAPI